MISDKLGRELHDRSTRGKQLTDEEQAQLKSWYEYQDDLESKSLGVMTGNIIDDKAITKLQDQIEATLNQIKIVTKRIQELTTENERLRQEINRLNSQLVQSSPIRQVA